MPDWADVWLPLSRIDQGAYRSRAWHSLIGVGRLKRAVSFDQAREDIGAIVERLRFDFPLTNGPTGYEMLPLDRELTGDKRAPLLALSVAVALVLLLACAERRQPAAHTIGGTGNGKSPRRALGATPAMLLRQFLLESWLVSLLGSVSGLLFSPSLLPLDGSSSRGDGPAPSGEHRARLACLAFTLLLSLFATAIALLALQSNLFAQDAGRIRNLARRAACHQHNAAGSEPSWACRSRPLLRC